MELSWNGSSVSSDKTVIPAPSRGQGITPCAAGMMAPIRSASPRNWRR